MPSWLLVSIGVAAGIVVISITVLLAVRPYLRHDFSEPWLPDATKRRDDPTGAGQLLDIDLPLGDDG